MNRQVVTFLSLFSLVLLLGVYYVSLPQHSSIKTVSSQASTPKKTKDTSYEQEIQKQNDKIADANADLNTKANAIVEKENIEKQNQLIQKLETKLKERNYDTTIHLKENSCIVYVHKVKDDKKIAMEVLKIVYSQLKDEYFIEVAFQ